ncbi:RNA polymerase sigma factor [Seonamhaeicola marinus]|uniref:RNA polymerase sigma factor n=1 Tax=Seonamhaeicola marinus TaxID=1912246 RepID=A0A5D0HVB7_9FLAO|nr:RNA polymerase sigma factor [Seonamhaeicola marinus]TYA74097.1 RNA polymerase sigma factor [Seonamhaeicola marinus]
MKNIESKFEDLYNANYNKVLRLCLGYSNGDSMLAKDLAQDVFIKVWENLKSFRSESNISTWIYRIAVNTCLLNLRKKKTLKVLGEVKDLEIDNDSSAEKEFKLKQLYECISFLNKESKSIILLELEGIPQKEIAEIMGISHQAIRVRIHRIKNELTKCVKK